jgi:hypothetical protein
MGPLYINRMIAILAAVKFDLVLLLTVFVRICKTIPWLHQR